MILAQHLYPHQLEPLYRLERLLDLTKVHEAMDRWKAASDFEQHSNAGKKSGKSRDDAWKADLDAAAEALIIFRRGNDELRYMKKDIVATLEAANKRPALRSKGGWPTRLKNMTKAQIEARAEELKSRN